MKFQSTLMLLLGVFMVTPVAAFYPNRLGSLQLTKDDYTLEDITESGILLAVAHYFESKPLAGRPTLSPGDLTGLQPLTASTLYSAYYGEGTVLPNKIEAAIQEIVSENTDISYKESGKAYWYMNGEELIKGNTKIKQMRAYMNGTLKNTPNYSVARLWIGRILHIMQMFYSNTDWLEVEIYKHYLKTNLIVPEVVNTYADLG
ncbi:von Willebrand factor A domain-containing protein 7-like [Anneissia japonica]|uniref:von Willebrand factor A domain-containing protein 7-like n=1 Tax=Anneissia japonica TaxID=1529436 RepID=UPI0014258AB6|nr:von Willebrand factor A domain-containing protein 7-like [Anneissia japonica]